jgi:hypothetical protein
MIRNVLGTVFVFASVFAVAYFLVQPLSHRITILGGEQVAFVSQMGARIEENPTNRIALDMKRRAEELDAKEQSLIEREILLQREQEATAHRTRNVLATTVGLSVLTLLLIHAYTKRRSDTHEIEETSHERMRHARIINTGLRVTIEQEPTAHHTHL